MSQLADKPRNYSSPTKALVPVAKELLDKNVCAIIRLTEDVSGSNFPFECQEKFFYVWRNIRSKWQLLETCDHEIRVLKCFIGLE